MRSLLVLLLLIVPVSAAPAETTVEWFLTGETGNLPDFDLQGVQFMGSRLANTDSQARFSSVGGGLPGTQGTVQTVTWYWPDAWPMDMEFLADARLTLYVEASVQASAQAKITLRALSPDGTAATIAQQDRTISVGATGAGGTGATAQSFDLAARGQVLPEGSTLELVVTLEGASLATVVRYDSAQYPSALSGLSTRPLDSDGDDLPNSLERRIGSDPLDNRDPGDGAFDSDGDGLPDTLEATAGTDPRVADTDGDGFFDGAEVRLDTDPLSASDVPADADGDGLADSFEARANTEASAVDSDSDGIEDCADDEDGDGLSNCLEQAWGSDPLLADTDGDGRLDGQEVAAGTDPNVHASPPVPRVRAVVEVVSAVVFMAAGLGLAIVGLTRRHVL